MSKLSRLTERVRSRLGFPKVNLEINDDDIEMMVEDAVVEIAPYVAETHFVTVTGAPAEGGWPCYVDMAPYGAVGVVKVFNSPTVAANNIAGIYNVNEFFVKQYQGELSRLLQAGQRQALLDALIPESWKYIDGKLYLANYYSTVTVEYIKDVEYETLADEKARQWVDRYVLALAKETVGRIRSKYKSGNFPVELDGDTLLSEGLSEKERLIGELAERNYGLFTVYR